MSWVRAGFAAVLIRMTAARNEAEENPGTANIQGYVYLPGRKNKYIIITGLCIRVHVHVY